MKQYFAEFTGTALLVWVGTGAIVVDGVYGGVIGHAGISLAFGVIVMLMILAFGQVSGAHINPAVSIAFWRAGDLPSSRLPGYLASQMMGAVLASVCLWMIFPQVSNYGMTLPRGTIWQSLITEVILSFILMTVILNMVRAKFSTVRVAVAVGATVALDAFIGGPISGASMNPARSFGPAVISGELAHLWLYLLGPVIGTLFAVLGCRATHREGCCAGAAKCA